MQGNKAFRFGKMELKASLNKASLLTSFGIAVLGWAAAEFIPQLTDESGIIGAIAGIAAQIVPIVIMYLRNNKDLEVVNETKKEE